MIQFKNYKNEELLNVYKEIKDLLEERGLLIKLKEKSIEESLLDIAIKKNSKWYFMVSDNGYPMTYLVRKNQWKSDGYIDDNPVKQDFVLPPKYIECQEMAYEYLNIHELDFITNKFWELSKEEINKVLEIHRKDFLDYGFTEVFWNDHPENKK